jgi:hypothetical protein
MTINLTEHEMNLTLSIFANKFAQISQWIESEEAKPTYDGLALLEAKDQRNEIYKLWNKFSDIDFKDMIKAGNAYAKSA